jgi:hypothetical protein
MKLASAGRDWVRQSLGDGNALAHEILGVCDLATGVASAAVPPGFPADGLDHPQWGQGMVSRRRSDEALADLIGGATPRLVVVEDPLMRPTDPVFERHARESFVFQSEVYHWRLRRQAEPYRLIGEFLNRWISYPFIAVVVRSSRPYDAGEEVTYEEIRRLAMSVESVVVGAYDNEGYIVWQPGWSHPSEP